MVTEVQVDWKDQKVYFILFFPRLFGKKLNWRTENALLAQLITVHLRSFAGFVPFSGRFTPPFSAFPLHRGIFFLREPIIFKQKGHILKFPRKSVGISDLPWERCREMFHFFPRNFLLPFLQPTKFQHEFMNIFCPSWISISKTFTISLKKKKREKINYPDLLFIHYYYDFLLFAMLKSDPASCLPSQWSQRREMDPGWTSPASSTNPHPGPSLTSHDHTLTFNTHQPISATSGPMLQPTWINASPGKVGAMTCHLPTRRDLKWHGGKKIGSNKIFKNVFC